MPNSVAGSPTHEAAKYTPEQTEPSELALEVSYVTFTPEPTLATAPALRSDGAHPESSLIALPSSEPMLAKSTDVTPYIPYSPSLIRAEAAPWEIGSLLAGRSPQHEQEALMAPQAISSRPNAVSIDRISTPPSATEVSPASVDNVSNAGMTISQENNSSTLDQASVHLLLATLSAQTERDQRLKQLTDELALKSALLEQAKADAAEATKRAGLELRIHADRLLAQTSRVEQKDAELVNMQTKLDEILQFREQHVRAIQNVTSRAADADERGQRACEQIGRVEAELAKVHAELEARKSELEEVRLRLTNAENRWAKSKTEANVLRAPGPNNTDKDQTICGLVERIRAMEDEVTSLMWSEKSLDEMECRNEG